MFSRLFLKEFIYNNVTELPKDTRRVHSATAKSVHYTEDIAVSQVATRRGQGAPAKMLAEPWNG